jgi:AraC-like DNA-binding protein
VEERRRVDWPIILGPDTPIPTILNRSARGGLASLLSTFDQVIGPGDCDDIARRAVDVARKRIGLDRVGIFLLDGRRQRMLGTWGTDLRRELVDERAIMYDVNITDREAFRRAVHEGEHYTVFDNCPIVDHQGGQTRIGGLGWVACTPIPSARGPLGILFNDAGLTGEAVDDDKQIQTALFCCLLGTVLDPWRDRLLPAVHEPRPAAGHPLVAAAAAMLTQDPSLGGKEVAAKLHISLSRLARVFKLEMGMSLVVYRNRLRLDRFMTLVDRGDTNLLDAALTAGFGSYAQFHRVFRALRRKTPREVLQHRR